RVPPPALRATSPRSGEGIPLREAGRMPSYYDLNGARAPVKRRPGATPSQPVAIRLPEGDGRRRVAIEAVSPEVDGGRFPSKRSLGERVGIAGDGFADGRGARSG